jgi:hypothetical protein
MVESRYGTCPDCDQYGNLKYHRCAPAWQCCDADDLEDDGTSGWTQDVRAANAEDAAEQYADEHCTADGEFQATMKVAVRPGPDAAFVLYDVTCEWVTSCSARLADG